MHAQTVIPQLRITSAQPSLEFYVAGLALQWIGDINSSPAFRYSSS